MPPTRELTYQDTDLEVKLVVGAATVLAGMRRALLTGRASAYLEAVAGAAEAGNNIDATARQLIARALYPDCLAAVVEAEGLDRDMDVATFMQLPEALTDAWQNLVYELNPRWYPFREPEEPEAEKKGVTPSSDTSASSS